MNLLEICLDKNYGTDKYFQKHHRHSYIEHFYEYALAPYRDTALYVLEIGIDSGDSLRLWRDYFTQAVITGVDHSSNHINEDRIITIHGDAYDRNTIDKLGNYDLMIDDGPHNIESQQTFLREYWSHLRPGGMMVIEDISPILGMDVIKLLESELPKADQRPVWGTVDMTAFDMWERNDSMLFWVKKPLLLG